MHTKKLTFRLLKESLQHIKYFCLCPAQVFVSKAENKTYDALDPKDDAACNEHEQEGCFRPLSSNSKYVQLDYHLHLSKERAHGQILICISGINGQLFDSDEKQVNESNIYGFCNNPNPLSRLWQGAPTHYLSPAIKVNTIKLNINLEPEIKLNGIQNLHK